MDTRSDNTGGGESADHAQDMVEQLIKIAGRREEPPAGDYDRVLTAALAAFRDKLRRQRRRRMTYGLAAAGMVAAVLVAISYQAVLQRPPIPLAAIERVIGTADVRERTDADWQAVQQDGRTVLPFTRIRTGPGSRLGLVLADKISLRLHESTEILLETPGRVQLVAGTVYADSGGAKRSVEKLEIRTPAGIARDLGTQFEVRFRDETLRLRVREGQVILRADIGETRSVAGDQLTISPSGQLTRTRVAGDDPSWQWVETVAPAPEINDKPLTVLLEWVSRETGRAIRFDKPILEVRAGMTILHGSIQHLAPLEALEVMLSTTDFDYTILEGGAVLIHERRR
jgi:ferric-dicitrate binding protein FerR (iron transport regulator)